MKYILGIGNPQPEHEFTYHNIGILAVNAFAETLTHSNWKKVHEFMYQEHKDLVFIKSLSYMNNSGNAAKELIHYFNARPETLLITHDDADIFLGKYKVTHGGCSGGHNGIESIIHALGTNNFWRLKIGIRDEKEMERKKADEIVLEPINKDHLKILESVFTDSWNALKNSFLKS